MHRMITFLCCLCVLVLLMPGCAKKEAKAVVQDLSDLSAVTPGALSKPEADPSITLKTMETVVPGGVLFLKHNMAYFYDMTNESEYPLCGKANCSHKPGDESCFAVFAEETPIRFLGIYEDKIFYFVHNMDISANSDRVYSADLDGSNRKKLYELDGQLTDRVIISKGRIYISVQKREPDTNEKGKAIGFLDNDNTTANIACLSTEGKLLYKTPELKGSGAYIGLVGVYQDRPCYNKNAHLGVNIQKNAPIEDAASRLEKAKKEGKLINQFWTYDPDVNTETQLLSGIDTGLRISKYHYAAYIQNPDDNYRGPLCLLDLTNGKRFLVCENAEYDILLLDQKLFYREGIGEDGVYTHYLDLVTGETQPFQMIDNTLIYGEDSDKILLAIQDEATDAVTGMSWIFKIDFYGNNPNLVHMFDFSNDY